ncbi:9955_t:CDS:2 [Acaulospora colombiana]|uniref:9955_t:CDS:1 n=1 Tax=Acaulospora colombiana TaxID=27376 RepID=A0ACA9PSW9_9GLOM|nr:9955_t:CDS:2 [Acaulospora colombiana]
MRDWRSESTPAQISDAVDMLSGSRAGNYGLRPDKAQTEIGRRFPNRVTRIVTPPSPRGGEGGEESSQENECSRSLDHGQAMPLPNIACCERARTASDSVVASDARASACSDIYT